MAPPRAAATQTLPMSRLLLLFLLVAAALLGLSGQIVAGASSAARSDVRHRGHRTHNPGPMLLGNRKLLGAPATDGPGRVQAYPFQAIRSGLARSVHLYVGVASRARSITVGLYSNAGGRPGSLLGSGSLVGPAPGAWNTIPVRHVRVHVGKTYWIGLVAVGGPLRYRAQYRRGCQRSMTSPTRVTTMPRRWSRSRRQSGCSLSAYVSTRPLGKGVLGSPTFPIAVGPGQGAGTTPGGAGSGAGGAGGSGTIPPGGCFASPGECGFPDPGYHNVGATSPCSSLAPAGSLTLSTPGQTITNLQVTGTITIQAPHVTLDNLCVTDNAGSRIGSSAIRLGNGASNATIEHVTVSGANSTTESVEQAITNTSGGIAAASYDYLSNCGECIWGGPWTVSDSYVIANGMQGTSDHLEDVYCSDATVSLTHDTLLNPADQTATLFCDTSYGGGGPCDNHISITGSLLAGGGFTVYTCGNASSAGSSTMNISNNRFARCTTPPFTYNPDTGGHACQGSSGTGIGSGADGHGYWQYGGYFGVADSVYCPPATGETWSGNVWDDNGTAVGCGADRPGAGG